MKWLRAMLLLSACLLATPIYAQRGSPTRPEPARPSPEPAREPSFVVPALIGVACAAVIIIVVCLPSRRARERDGKP